MEGKWRRNMKKKIIKRGRAWIIDDDDDDGDNEVDE